MAGGVWFWVATASAATLTVGPDGDYASVGEALVDALAGDEIVVSGEHPDPVTVAVDVTIRAADPAAPPTFTGGDPAFTIDAAVTLADLVLRPEGRGLDVLPGADLVAIRLDVRTATVDGDGAGLRVTEATALVQECAFIENVATAAGGHVAAIDSTLTLDGALLNDGGARFGGAVVVRGGDATIADTAFAGNRTERDGGAVYVEGGTVAVSGSTFDDNATPDEECRDSCEGGAVHFTAGAVWSVEASRFTGNAAAESLGGAIANREGATGTVVASTFTGNTARFGGALYLGGAGDITLDGCRFDGNTATDGGGGAARWRPDAGEPTLRVVDCAFVGNDAHDDGGALALNTTNGPPAVVVLDGNHFESNVAERGGGGVSILTVPTIEGRRNRFCRNVADTDGGGLRVSSGGATADVWTNNVFLDNEATLFGGGAAFSDAGAVVFHHNHLVGNAADAGGGLRAMDGPVDLRNTLVAHTRRGTGLSMAAQPIGWALFWANSPQDLGGDLTVDDRGDGLVDADPLLLGWVDGGPCTMPLLPEPGSPAIDAGEPSGVDLDGSRADLGAFGGPDATPGVVEDGDGDGTVAAADCDDTDPDVFPGAPETCDGRDEDCDGAVDEDAVDGTTWFVDADEDGRGDPASAVVACEPPDGWVDRGEDCDDSDPDVSPDAIEVCDGVDQDCDGLPDDGLLETWFADGDGDGFGDPAVSVEACSMPSGYAADASDCDDGDATVYPEAPEVDGDGIDQDCDGVDPAIVEAGDTGGGSKDEGGCGCDAAGSGMGAWVLLLALARVRSGRPSRPSRRQPTSGAGPCPGRPPAR